MTDRIFLRISERCALGADDLQWIVYVPRRKGIPDDSLSSRDWTPVSFIRSTKERLIRCMPGVDAARSALAGYPDTFDEWKAAQSAARTSGTGKPRTSGDG